MQQQTTRMLETHPHFLHHTLTPFSYYSKHYDTGTGQCNQTMVTSDATLPATPTCPLLGRFGQM
eukprot:14560594-Ditylum_brightwellii.AAC.1